MEGEEEARATPVTTLRKRGRPKKYLTEAARREAHREVDRRQKQEKRSRAWRHKKLETETETEQEKEARAAAFKEFVKTLTPGLTANMACRMWKNSEAEGVTIPTHTSELDHLFAGINYEHLPTDIVDLGSGSKNIKRYLALRIPQARVVSVDKEPRTQPDICVNLLDACECHRLGVYDHDCALFSCEWALCDAIFALAIASIKKVVIAHVSEQMLSNRTEARGDFFAKLAAEKRVARIEGCPIIHEPNRNGRRGQWVLVFRSERLLNKIMKPFGTKGQVRG
ncbi:hypothetical protein CYMTET_17155 [Cymbomonas tetramitiformis]|uniref:Uncharacterized protein n=1 Tax=Cymbomonas tetramitiformis TaxID=36881 RepID=A0AAE0GC22_9CHLO|nr:hypothetical protein CYMTET_17155 [Cymbomonas tetramitiformis]